MADAVFYYHMFFMMVSLVYAFSFGFMVMNVKEKTSLIWMFILVAYWISVFIFGDFYGYDYIRNYYEVTAN